MASRRSRGRPSAAATTAPSRRARCNGRKPKASGREGGPGPRQPGVWRRVGPARAGPARSHFEVSSHLETGGGGDRRRRPPVDGADDLAAVDALEVHAGDAEVGVLPELALDNHERDTFMSHLDSVSMAKLVWREAPSHTRGAGGVVQLVARGRRFPAAASGRAVDHA